MVKSASLVSFWAAVASVFLDPYFGLYVILYNAETMMPAPHAVRGATTSILSMVSGDPTACLGAPHKPRRDRDPSTP